MPSSDGNINATKSVVIDNARSSNPVIIDALILRIMDSRFTPLTGNTTKEEGQSTYEILSLDFS